jgi:hypothetical protein
VRRFSVSFAGRPPENPMVSTFDQKHIKSRRENINQNHSGILNGGNFKLTIDYCGLAEASLFATGCWINRINRQAQQFTVNDRQHIVPSDRCCWGHYRIAGASITM